MNVQCVNSREDPPRSYRSIHEGSGGGEGPYADMMSCVYLLLDVRSPPMWPGGTTRDRIERGLDMLGQRLDFLTPLHGHWGDAPCSNLSEVFY